MWLMVFIVTRARTIWNFCLSLIPKFVDSSVVIELAVLVVGARASFRIFDLIWSTGVVLPLPLWVAVVLHLVRLVVFVIARTRAIRDSGLSAVAEFLNASVVIKLAVFIVSTRASFWVLDLFRSLR